MANFTFKIYSPFVGADITEEIEIEDSKLEGLSASERNAHIDIACNKWMLENVEWGWEEE